MFISPMVYTATVLLINSDESNIFSIKNDSREQGYLIQN